MTNRLGFPRRASLATLAVIVGAALVGGPTALAASPPTYDHVVLAIFENHAQSQIIGASDAPFLTGLAAQGANFTQSFALRHPSQPNYLDLFSGSNQGVTNNDCPQSFASNNLAHQLISSGRTFVGYAEDLPSADPLKCDEPPPYGTRGYARRHVPWTNFSNLNQASVNRPFTAFPSDFTKLPTASWVVPNNCNNMHDCPVSTGDTWARDHLSAYAQWAKTHNSLLIVTFDEDDNTPVNQIATFFVGARIVPGNYSERIDHFTVLRTIEAMYGLPGLGFAADRSPITDVFASAPTAPTTPLQLTNVSQSLRRWRLGNNLPRFAAPARLRLWTTFRFGLNRTATVRFAFAQRLPGRNVNRKCVAQTARNRRNKACTRSVPSGAISFSVGAGMHRLFFQGRLTRTSKLRLGTYALTITATDAAGQRASKTLTSFTIARR